MKIYFFHEEGFVWNGVNLTFKASAHQAGAHRSTKNRMHGLHTYILFDSEGRIAAPRYSIFKAVALLGKNFLFKCDACALTRLTKRMNK